MHFFLKSLICTHNHMYIIQCYLLLIFNRDIILIGCSIFYIFLNTAWFCILQLQWRKKNSDILGKYPCQIGDNSDFNDITRKLRNSRIFSGNQRSNLTLSLKMFLISSSSSHCWIGSWQKLRLFLLSRKDLSSTAISTYIFGKYNSE